MKEPTPRRRWLRIGPGLLLALTAIAWGWPYLFPPAAKPKIERTLQSQSPMTAPSAPDPTWLLSQRTSMKMSDAQFQKLSALQQRWTRDTRQLQGSIDAATRDFNASMNADKGATMEQLQTRAAPLTELSRQMSDARRAWWSEASLTLEAKQRKRAQELWSQHLAASFTALKTPDSQPQL